MASPAQINANRENAKKSTGPSSADGKAASSRNSLKHGLCAEKHLLTDEDGDEFAALFQDLFNRFRPVGEGEAKLVTRIASTQWRLDRARAIETQIYGEQLAILARINPEMSQEEREAETRSLGPCFMMDCSETQSLTRLARYETSLERSITASLRQLEQFQKARAQAGVEAEPTEPIAAPENEITKRTQTPGAIAVE